MLLMLRARLQAWRSKPTTAGTTISKSAGGQKLLLSVVNGSISEVEIRDEVYD